MPVIVDEGLVPEWLSLHDKTGRTEGRSPAACRSTRSGATFNRGSGVCVFPALPVTGKAVPDIAAAPSIAVDWCKNLRREIAGTGRSTRR